MNLKIDNEDDFKNILKSVGKGLEKIGDGFINQAFMLQKELNEVKDEHQKLQLEKEINELEEQIELMKKHIKNILL